MGSMPFHLSQRQLRNVLLLVLLISLAIHATTLALSQTIFSQWQLQHLPLHSFVEAVGSLVAFFVAYLLLVAERRGGGTHFNVPIAGALLAMGVLDGLHALVHPGNAFVWLHSMATFMGGLLFSCIFLPRSWFQRHGKRWLVVVLLSVLMLGITSLLWPQSLPVMVDNGEFTTLAFGLNVVGGVFFLASAIRLLLSFRQHKKTDDLLFVLHCSMFGLAAIMFQQSQLWDMAWWGWHLLRLLAYGVALWFGIRTEAASLAFVNESLAELSERYANQSHEISSLQTLLQRSENTQLDILNSLTDAVIICDKSGDIILFTESAEKLFGYDSTQIIGCNIASLMGGEDATHHHRYMKNYRSGQGSVVMAQNRELNALRQDGSSIPVEIVVNELDFRGDYYFVGLVRDISERREMQNAQRLALEEAQASSRMKSEFLSNMSHEVRTPLNAIYGHLQLVCAEEDLPDSTRKSIDTAEFACQQLLHIVNDILDISKIEAGKLSIENTPFDLGKVFRGVCEMGDRMVESKPVIIKPYMEPNLPIVRLGDPTRIAQIFTNLVSNAAKFTHSGLIDIALSRDEDYADGAAIQFTVKDTGIGMAPQQLQKVFDRFEQADGSTTRKFGGTGLGLAITYALTQLMNGSIEVTSEEGQGTQFVVCLPLPVSEIEQTREKPAVQDNNIEQIDVLVVDDQELNREIVKCALETTGAQFREADGGRAAIKQVQNKAPDIVLLDIQMPDMDGMEVCATLRSMGYSKPVVALTANVMTEDVENYKNSGFNDCVGKPFELQELIDCIARNVHSDA